MNRKPVKNDRTYQRHTLIERRSPFLSEKKTFLIVCEGQSTEPSYFKQFFDKNSKARITAKGEGKNTLTLVKRAIQLSKEYQYDYVWCVFDRDTGSHDLEQFNSAIDLAEKNGFEVAYSNQAFEYWFILHFKDHQGGPMHRDEYNDEINKYIYPKAEYDGKRSKSVSPEFFNILRHDIDPHTKEKRIDLAIKRAKRNCKIHSDNNIPPAKAESSTTVYKLVEEILQYI